VYFTQYDPVMYQVHRPSSTSTSTST